MSCFKLPNGLQPLPCLWQKPVVMCLLLCVLWVLLSLWAPGAGGPLSEDLRSRSLACVAAGIGKWFCVKNREGEVIVSKAPIFVMAQKPTKLNEKNIGPNEPLPISFDLIIKSTHLLRRKYKEKQIQRASCLKHNCYKLSGYWVVFFFFFFPLQPTVSLPTLSEPWHDILFLSEM